MVHRVAPPDDAGIVDENVDRTERGAKTLDGVLRLGGVQRLEVEGQGVPLSAGGGDGTERRLPRSAVHGDRDVGAGLGQPDRDGRADAARPARHQRAAALQGKGETWFAAFVMASSGVR